MATGTINFYSNFKKLLLDGSVDLDNDTITIALLNEGYTPVHTHSATAQLSNEVTTGGYARKQLGSISIAATASAFTFDAADVVWTASGAAFTAYHWVMIDETVTDDALLAWGLIDNSPAKVAVADGNTLTLVWNGNGILKID
jgi:hypothetical protein